MKKLQCLSLGESVTEGTISKWLVSVGDKVNKYDPLAEVMTDKVNAEIPSSFTGIIKELIAEEGETLAVGEVICTIESARSRRTQNVATKEDEQTQNSQKQSTVNKNKQVKKPRYSPAVLKLSQEHGIDLTQVGTGAGGRITRKDLLKLIDSGNIQLAEIKMCMKRSKLNNVTATVKSALKQN